VILDPGGPRYAETLRVIGAIAATLPDAEPGDLDDRLRDVALLLGWLDDAAWRDVAARLWAAAERTLDPERRERVERLARTVAAGRPGEDAPPATRTGAAKSEPVWKGPKRRASREEYLRFVNGHALHADRDYSPGANCEGSERWLDANGRIVAEQYFVYINHHMPLDEHYFVCDE
jgi:hypothetical protein